MNNETLTADDLIQLLVDEHDKELERTGADVGNYANAQSNDQISSKTDLGVLFTMVDLKTGKVSHEWEDGDPGTPSDCEFEEDDTL